MSSPFGGRHPRPDAQAKVAGQTRYVADLAMPGMLHAAVAVAPLPSARLAGVNVEAARRHPEVVAVLTAADVPGDNQVGVIFPDQPLLAVDRVRMVGERLAVVAARTPAAAWAAARAVEGRFEQLPAVHDPEAALRPGSPSVHPGGNLVACQTIAAAALGVDPARVEVWQPDTTTVADSGPTVASRGAHASGMAILDAVRRLRRRLDPVAAELLGCRPDQVELAGGVAKVAGGGAVVPLERVAGEMAVRRVEAVATGWHRSPERAFDPATGLGSPYESYAFACHVARVRVDPDLGLITVGEVAAVHDVGTVLHRDALKGQIEGGVAQAVGWAVSEQLAVEDGRLRNPSFTDYLIPTAADVPEVRIALLECGDGTGPFGAKGVGEPSFIPAAAAVRNAVVDALGVEVDRLPMTPAGLVAILGGRHRLARVLRRRPVAEAS